jgi:hypothetical protein
MTRWIRALVLALIAPLVLSGCLFFPGKFESTLVIHADRSFTYSYKGEVLAVDLEGLMGKAMQAGMAAGAKSSTEDADKAEGEDKADDSDKAEDADAGNATPPAMPDLTLTPDEQAKQDDNFRKLAVELAKESGYRTVEYRGKGVFFVDYQISGFLTHGLVFPYNYDNHVLMPWLLVEVRGKDMIRVKAPGFARLDGSSMGGMGGMGGMGAMGAFPMPGAENAFTGMDGTFTLITDGELVAQNNENGATAAGITRTVVWKVTSNTPDAPMASIRVKPLL